MTEFNLQDIFDRALAHLRKQGKRAVDREGFCVYRAPDGCACAIGGLIPDERYSADLEGESAASLTVAKALGFNLGQLSQDDRDFLLYLQRDLHDSLPDDGFPAHLELAAKRFATEHDLRFTPPPPAEGGVS